MMMVSGVCGVCGASRARREREPGRREEQAWERRLRYESQPHSGRALARGGSADATDTTRYDTVRHDAKVGSSSRGEREGGRELYRTVLQLFHRGRRDPS